MFGFEDDGVFKRQSLRQIATACVVNEDGLVTIRAARHRINCPGLPIADEICHPSILSRVDPMVALKGK